MMFLGTTPANRPDSPEYAPSQQAQFDANYRSLHDEQLLREAEMVEDEGRTPRYTKHMYCMYCNGQNKVYTVQLGVIRMVTVCCMYTIALMLILQW